MCGGEYHPDNPGTYTSGDDAISLKVPNREGYSFEVWLPVYTIPAGSTGDKSFTAQWAIIEGYYSITYVLDGGENHPDNPGTYTSGDDAITLRDPNRAGYAFEGWLPENTIPSGSTGEKTFTAQWAILTYSIGYELNAGTNHSDNPTGYTVESATVSLQNPYRPGYTFEGWAEGNTIASGSTGDKIFTAQWSPRYYEIKYELGGGTNHPDNPEVYTGIDEITLQNPFREGYTFEGWAEGNTIPAGSTGDRTFTAQWSIITGYYRIVYVLDGGTNHPANPEVYTENDGITLQNPVRTGYTFDGWAEGNTIPAGSTGDKTFTAQWKCSEANIVEITLDGVNITGRENGGVFKYSIDGCDKTSLMLNLNVSPGANVSVNGEAYPSSGYEIVPDGGPASIASVSIRIVSEAGDNAVEYTLRIALPAGGSLYYQRWSDVLAVNVNP
ncbi:MAG: InlB B-repeat-containing protein, partial [Prevotellaceae bacterium]|nr:InlB B-repeat-containing protein [Prevotellaceae bacterium]